MSHPDPVESQSEREIFFEALGKSGKKERADFLEGACFNKPDLRRRVEALLASHAEQDSFMEDTALDSTITLPRETDLSEKAGTVIGRFTLLEKLGADAHLFEQQFDMQNWPKMKEQMTAIILRKTRDEWDEVFAGANVCYAPVLSMAEVRHHPHHQARKTFIDDGEVWQPAPAPRFSRTQAEIHRCAAAVGEHSEEILREFGFTQDEIAARIESGAVHRHSP